MLFFGVPEAMRAREDQSFRGNANRTAHLILREDQARLKGVAEVAVFWLRLLPTRSARVVGAFCASCFCFLRSIRSSVAVNPGSLEPGGSILILVWDARVGEVAEGAGKLVEA